MKVFMTVNEGGKMKIFIFKGTKGFEWSIRFKEGPSSIFQTCSCAKKMVPYQFHYLKLFINKKKQANKNGNKKVTVTVKCTKTTNTKNTK